MPTDDPFLPLALASQSTTTLGLGTAVAIGFARNPIVLAVRAIWDRWQTDGQLRFEGDFYHHTLMTPAFNPGPNPYGHPPVFVGGFGPRMIEVAGEVADGLIVYPFNTRHQRRPMPRCSTSRATTVCTPT